MIISKRPLQILQLLLIIVAVLLITDLVTGNQPSKASQDTSAMTIQMNLVPSMVESGHAVYSLGYVTILNRTGFPTVVDSDITVKLQSSDPTIASVPSTITIPKKSSYTNFNVTTGSDGKATISANFNGQSISQQFVVGTFPVNYPPNTQLVLNLPSNSTDVNSNMIFSVYLQVNNTIIAAPKDVHIILDYDSTIIKTDSNEMVIKKGEYYAVGTITTLAKTGNAYLKVTSDNPSLSVAQIIKISSTEPTSLQMFIFPRLIAYTEGHFDVFVGLFDSEGHPAIASQDVTLRFTSNDTLLSDELDKQAGASYSSDTIKKGDFGLYDRFQYTFVNTKNYSLYVSAPNLGTSNTNLTLSQSLPLDNQYAANSYVTVNTLKEMPPNSTAIVTYQLFSEAEHVPKGTEFIANGNNLPSTSSKPYSSDPELDNLQVTTTDESIATVQNPVYILPGYSYGTAIISSGQNSGKVNIVASVKGIGNGQNFTRVYSTRDITSSEIFSPAGNYMVFDNNNTSTLYFVLLDASKRPQYLKTGIQFLIHPTQDILQIPPLERYSDIVIQSSKIDTSQNTVLVHGEPVGAGVNSNLAASSIFAIAKPMGSLQLNVGVQHLASIFRESNPIGVVQIFDIYGNPTPATNDVVVTLSSNSSNAMVPSSVVIKKGSSFAQFPITTASKPFSVMISAATNYYGKAQNLIEIQPYTPTMNLDMQYPDTIAPNLAANIQAKVTDEFGDPVSNVRLDFISGLNETVTPQSVFTGKNGIATVSFSSEIGPQAVLTVDASKNGYVGNETQISLNVVQGAIGPQAVQQPTGLILGLPGWILYVIIAGIVAAVGAGAFMFLRKPKVVEEEEGETEI